MLKVCEAVLFMVWSKGVFAVSSFAAEEVFGREARLRWLCIAIAVSAGSKTGAAVCTMQANSRGRGRVEAETLCESWACRASHQESKERGAVQRCIAATTTTTTELNA